VEPSEVISDCAFVCARLMSVRNRPCLAVICAVRGPLISRQRVIFVGGELERHVNNYAP
jgi:hypothetical protein